jgi:hypothetical protein
MTPRINAGALFHARQEPGVPQQPAARGLPEWATASVVWDVDGVLLLEVMSWRPSRSVSRILGDLANSLSEQGWAEEAHGALPWTRPDGVGCPGGWISFVRRGSDATA